jgi:hypothetical protein
MFLKGGPGDTNTKTYLVSHLVTFFCYYYYSVTAFCYELLSGASPSPPPAGRKKKREMDILQAEKLMNINKKDSAILA